MSDQNYRAAVLGCGGRGREHIIGLLADARVKIVALADSNPEAAEDCNQTFGLGASLYRDIPTLLKGEKPDIAVIALWTKLHSPVFNQCVEHGVRLVMSEKPMSDTWDKCREMSALAESSGTVLTFCHQRRFSSRNLVIRGLLEQGKFGKIERMDLFSPPHLLDCGTHTFDQALSFNRESPARWVHGAVDLSKPVKFYDVPAEGESIGTVMFENGVFATFRSGGQDMDMWGGVRVIGSEGFVEAFWDGEIRRAVLYKDRKWTLKVDSGQPNEQMIGTVRNAVDAFETGTEPELSHKKAIRTAEILFALYESSRTRERICLPLDGLHGNPVYEMLNPK